MTSHLVSVLGLKGVKATGLDSTLVSVMQILPIFSPKLLNDPNKSNGWTLGQSVGPNKSNVQNESHVALFRNQRV